MTMRENFESWANNEFYSGLADVADTWDEGASRYMDAAHQMAWKAYQAAWWSGACDLADDLNLRAVNNFHSDPRADEGCARENKVVQSWVKEAMAEIQQEIKDGTR